MGENSAAAGVCGVACFFFFGAAGQLSVAGEDADAAGGCGVAGGLQNSCSWRVQLGWQLAALLDPETAA